MTTKEQIAEALEEIATLLELKEQNPFKIRAYQNAARSIEAFGASFSDLQNQEALEKIPGIGESYRGENQRTGNHRWAQISRRTARGISVRHSRIVFHS